MKVDHICKECGKRESRSWVDECAKELTSKRLCFTCNHWYKRIDKKGVIIIDGDCYHNCGYQHGPSNWKGYGGRNFTIEMNDGTIIETNNLSHNGTIPDRFKERLPDNAKFIDQVLSNNFTGF